MTLTTCEMFRRLCRLIPNLSVLSCLLGALAWGHTTHWSLGGGYGTDERGKDASPAGGAGHYGNANSARHERTGSSNGPRHGEPPASADDVKLRIVKFDNRDDAAKAGLAVGEVREREMDEHVTANGVVTYDQTRLAQLSVRVPGRVWRVEKQVGQSVRQGDVLVVLDSVDVGQAKAEFLQSVVQYDLAVKNLSRLKSITDYVPERLVRGAEAEVRQNRVRRFNGHQTLINLGLPIDLADLAKISDDDLTERIHFLGIPDSIAQSFDRRTTTANLIPLIAPFDGVVIGRELVAGEIVEPAHPQFTLADVRKMWILLNVDREDAVRLEIGQEMSFHADAMPREVTSRISWISTEVDQKTRTVQVRAEVQNPKLDGGPDASESQRLLRANMFGTGRICVKCRPQAVAVPGDAIHVKGTRKLVFLPLEDGRSFEPREVRTGISRGGFTEVVAGLAVGDQVVTTGSYMLKSELFGSRE